MLRAPAANNTDPMIVRICLLSSITSSRRAARPTPIASLAISAGAQTAAFGPAWRWPVDD